MHTTVSNNLKHFLNIVILSNNKISLPFNIFLHDFSVTRNEDIDNLEIHLPHVTINEKSIHIAGNFSPENKIWEIEANQMKSS